MKTILLQVKHSLLGIFAGIPSVSQEIFAENPPQNEISVSGWADAVIDLGLILGSGPFVTNPYRTSTGAITLKGGRMTNDTRVQTVQDLIGALVASWPEGYAGVRAVLEELVEALPVQGPHPVRMAVRDYIARHCQACGAPVSRIVDDTVADLEVLRAGVADVREVQGGDQEVLCSSCYVRLAEGDDATWLDELREAQHERPLGLFGRPAETVLADNRDQRQRDQPDPAPDAWPLDYVETTFGSLPELERFPQGAYERRDPLD